MEPMSSTCLKRGKRPLAFKRSSAWLPEACPSTIEISFRVTSPATLAINQRPEATMYESLGTSKPRRGHEIAQSVCRKGRYLRMCGRLSAALSTHPPIEKAMKEMCWSSSFSHALLIKSSTSIASRSANVSIGVLVPFEFA